MSDNTKLTNTIKNHKTILKFNYMNIKVAFCFIVKDGADYLQKNIDTLKTISENFLLSHIFAIENDSKDTTRNILSKEFENGCITAFKLLDLDGKSSVELCKKERKYNCSKRTKRLAYLRAKH